MALNKIDKKMIDDSFVKQVEDTTTKLAETDAKKVSKKDIYSNDYTPPNVLSLKDFSGYNEPYHPSVMYFANGFAGYKYWMVQTPLPVGALPYRDRWECPVVYKSNDGENWITVADPLDDLTPSEVASMDYFSDPHLVFRDGTLEVWYRLSTRSKPGLDTNIIRKVTTDGENWSAREEMIPPKVNTAPDFMRSPSVIWDVASQRYRAWYQSNSGLFYNTSADGKTWGTQQALVLNTPHNTWHLDVNFYDGFYHLLSYSSSSEDIAYYKSTDGINFTFVKIILASSTGDDSYSLGLYRAVSLKGVDGKVMLYSSATTSKNKTAIILLVAPSLEEINPIGVLKNTEKMGRVIVNPVDTHTTNSPLSDFTPGYITQNIVRNASAINSPNGIGGLLVTDYTSSASLAFDTLVYQTYYERSSGSANGNIYVRNALVIEGNPWGQWSPVNAPEVLIVKPANSHTPSNHYSVFPKGRITQNIVTNANSAGSPNGTGGLMVTDCTSMASLANDVLAFQTYYERPVGSVGNIYWRKTKSTDSQNWSDWELINKPHVSWFGKVSISSSTFTVLSNLKIANYVQFDAILSEGGTTPTLSKTLWSRNEISTDSTNPTAIGTTGTHPLQMYRDAANNIYIKYGASGNNFPLVVKMSAF